MKKYYQGKKKAIRKAFVSLSFVCFVGISLGYVHFHVFGEGGPRDDDFAFVDSEDINSQMISLLEVSAGPLSFGGVGGPPDEDLVIIEDSALQGTSGPRGTIMNLADVPRGRTTITKYVVRPGDTLSEIADLFNVSGNTIRWQNKMDDEEILHAGDIVEILPVTGFQYTVVKNDTVEGIAKKYGSTTDSIVSENNLSSKSLTVGAKIIVPNGNPEKDAVEKKSEKMPVSKKFSGSTTAHARGGVALSKSELGDYVWPVDGGIVTQGYGTTDFAQKSGYYKADFHGGVDIGAPIGTRVFATKSGTVTESDSSGYNGGYGNLIALKHDDGTMSRYGHLSKNLVHVGDHVAQGQNIGLVGVSGRSTGPHLHFEIRDKNGKQLETNPFYKKYKNY